MDNHQQTLPIDLNDGIYFCKEAAQATGAALSAAYTSATPFPHIVIDNFLPTELIETILANFPIEKSHNEINYEKGYKGLHKRQVDPNQCNQYLRGVFHFFNSVFVALERSGFPFGHSSRAAAPFIATSG